MNKNKLIDQLIVHEGLKLTPYKDTVGKLTIGVGHNLTDNGITKVQALCILADDIAEVEKFIRANFPWYDGLDDVRQRVVADMCFNLGPKILQFKRFLEFVKTKQWEMAAVAMLDSLWARQVGKRAMTLARMMKDGTD